MSANDALTLVRLASAIGILTYASVLDWRTRRVPNPALIVLSLIGVFLIPVQLLVDEDPLGYALVLIPIGAILADVFLDVGDQRRGPIISLSLYILAVASILILAYANLSHGHLPHSLYHLLAVPVLMLIFVVMYYFDLIRGGADAKALISLAVLFPFYPDVSSFPLVSVAMATADFIPFTFTVLVTAAIIVALAPLAFLVINIARKDYRFPQAFFGLRKGYKELKGKHYWLMERMEGDSHVLFTRPRHDEDLDLEVEKLVKAGHTRLWVTAKIPFIIPILLGLIISAVLGNVLLLLIASF